jgi:uncharacterized protein YggL (DUF469 family)
MNRRHGRSWRSPVQQRLPKQEFQKTGLSVQAPSSANSDKLQVSTAVQHVMTDLSEAVSEKDKIMIIKKW